MTLDALKNRPSREIIFEGGLQLFRDHLPILLLMLSEIKSFNQLLFVP